LTKPNPYIPDPYPDLPALAMVNLAALTREQLHEYRLELTHAVINPGLEYDLLGDQTDANRKAYIERIEQIKNLLGDD
jgi:hypothetical protein